MLKMQDYKKFIIFIIIFFTFTSCAKEGFFKPGDARKISPDPRERVKKNLEEGKGFRLNNAIGARGRGTNFDLRVQMNCNITDVLDFMPLTSANYSGGIIITDWYSEQGSPDESIKITIRFLSNEVRSDAIDVDIFYKKCIAANNCKINKQDGQLKKEITKQILAKAAVYKKQSKDKNFRPYKSTSADNKRE